MRSPVTALPLLLVVLLAGTLLAAQQPGGVPREPIESHPHDLESSYLRMPLPAGAERYAQLDGERMKGFLREIVAVSERSRSDGELLWGRIAGTAYDDMVEGVVQRQFEEFGLKGIERQYFDLPPQWFPTAWAFTATSGGRTLRFETARAATRSAATPPGGLDLEPVWVGLGTEADFAGRDVRGKLVLIQSMPMPGVVSHSASHLGAAARAVEKGAAAIALNVAIPGNMQVQTGPGNTKVATFTIGTEDMTRLRQEVERGSVRVHVALSTEQRTGLRDASVWGTLPGTTDENIIIMAHHDAYFQGAMDNASGMAVMLGLAEHYAARPAAERRRTLRFVTTSGHHAGSMGTAWLHANRDSALRGTVLAINCEHVSVTQAYFDRNAPVLRRSDNIDARRWWVHGSRRLANLALESWRMFGVTLYDTMENNASGDMRAMDRDVPSIQLIESAVYYHSDHDTPEVVPAAGLEAVARAYARIIDQVNTLSKDALLPAPVRGSAGQE
ncbi:MAG: M28 family peptidase [Vicinamibacterales bacterium]